MKDTKLFGWAAFEAGEHPRCREASVPSRFSELLFPVLKQEYAEQIARDWSPPDPLRALRGSSLGTATAAVAARSGGSWPT